MRGAPSGLQWLLMSFTASSSVSRRAFAAAFCRAHDRERIARLSIAVT